MKTQKDMILNHLRVEGGITALEALTLYGCNRLAPRILELKDAGNDIRSKLIAVKGRSGTAWVSRYSL